jgi:16S rRNA (guanine527-N7)-methyltransferase
MTASAAMADAAPVPGIAGVSRETSLRFARLADLVAQWTPRINLIAPASLDEIATRHIADSAQLADLAPHGWAHWVDLGSGAGFPGLVIAVLAQDSAPGRRITLVDSDQRKAAFLRTAIRELGLGASASVLAARAESLPPLSADVLSARALAPLPALLPLARRHLAPAGRALFPKGRRAGEEIAAARAAGWQFDLLTHPSRTDPEARILDIGEIAHA